ncbi:MAG TPA: SAM-dependent methyltransferase [Caulobacteraceae bacterium]|jgi:SAM-dependent methyltransferase
MPLTRRTRSLAPDFFEDLYQREGDPWSFETSPYETEKYRITVNAIASPRASRCLEVGCSIGVLTRQLASVVDSLVATDVSTTALLAAERRCSDLTNVSFRRVSAPEENFQGGFDLIVLSEVVYYWDDGDLDGVAAGILQSLEPGGRLLMVHFLGETDYPKSGDEAVEALGARLSPEVSAGFALRNEKFRLDLWQREQGAGLVAKRPD